MSMGIGLGVGLSRGWRANPGWRRILTLAAADGWTAVYDPTNPDTRTLREDAGDAFAEELADGRENRATLVQATAARQPKLSAKVFGALDGLTYDASAIGAANAGFTDIAQPWITLAVVQNTAATPADFARVTTGSDEAAGSATEGISGVTTGGVWRILSGTTLASGVAADTNPHILAGVYNGASSAVYLDSALIASGNAGDKNMIGLYLGARSDLIADTRWEGHIGPVLLRSGSGLTEMQAMADLLHDLTGIAKA
jgi:hypothetical protein